ncbi:type II toxin-antitoxin system RelE/ParE family toxin [Patescibacteria group bacterium]|nr:type II toxin-antitoxin system RelE/ParE family toxin [Patescibacteria group bacterium]
MYKVVFKSRAEKIFGKLDRKIQQQIVVEIEKLAQDPFLKSNVKKISGTEYGYRLRIGRWRVLFSLYADKNLVEVIDIFMEKSKKDYTIRKRLFVF